MNRNALHADPPPRYHGVQIKLYPLSMCSLCGHADDLSIYQIRHSPHHWLDHVEIRVGVIQLRRCGYVVCLDEDYAGNPIEIELTFPTQDDAIRFVKDQYHEPYPGSNTP